MIRVVWQKGNKITYKHFPSFLTYKEADELGKQRGYGKTLIIGFQIPFLKRILKAGTDLVAGLRYHYPICCVINYCIDTILDRPSAQLRWSSRANYVECAWHIRKSRKEQIPNDLY